MSASIPASSRSKLSLYLDLIRFDRPAGWLVLVWPTLVALWVASNGFPGWHLLIVFVLGTVLMRSAGCTINDIADRDFDKHVKRTTQRPITSGQISVKEAAMVGLVLTLVSFGLLLGYCEQVADKLAAEGIGCDVIDLRTTSPLDEEAILDSVEVTGRLVVVDEAPPRCNIATDIISLVANKGYEALKAPPQAVTPPHTPVPFARELESAYLPSPEKIEAAVRKTLAWK